MATLGGLSVSQKKRRYGLIYHRIALQSSTERSRYTEQNVPPKDHLFIFEDIADLYIRLVQPLPVAVVTDRLDRFPIPSKKAGLVFLSEK